MSDSSKAYRDTLNLPATDFPMKADLARQEPAQLARWDAEGVYRALRDLPPRTDRFVLHDGPPYANGHIHIGHALNKILKDIIIKFQTMTGRDAPYIPGWDCHGLPIEHQVLKDLGPKKQGMSTIEIRKRCREYAEKFVDIQRDEFKRSESGRLGSSVSHDDAQLRGRHRSRVRQDRRNRSRLQGEKARPLVPVR
jgi:isoleucyl-tRNA synthetase